MSSISDNNRRLAKNSVILGIRMVIVLLLTLYTTRVILSVLGDVDYGVYIVVCGFVAMFTFLNTSMSNGIQRFLNYELGRGCIEGAIKVYTTAVLIQLLLVFLTIILTETVGLWYLHHKMVIPPNRIQAAQWIFQFSILSFIFIIMQAPYTAAVIAHERMDFYAFVSVLDAILKLGIVIILPCLRGDLLIWYGFLFLLISVLNFSLYFFFAYWRFPEIRLSGRIDFKMFRSMLVFSGWNIFGSLSGVAQEHGANLVLNFFFGPVVNAARGIAVQITGALQSFVGNITIPVRPQVVQSYAQGEINRTMHLTYSISKLSCCFYVLMAVPVALEIDFVLHLWLGSNVPSHTDTFTFFVLLTSLTSNLNSACSNVVHATGKMKNYQLWGSLVKISSVPLAYFLLLRYHIPELALFSVWIMNLCGHIVCLFVLRTLVPFSLLEYCKRVVLPIILVLSTCLICAYPIHLFFNQGWIRLIVVSIISAISVSISLYYLALENAEQALLRNLLKSLTKKTYG